MKPELDFAGRQVAGSRDAQEDYYGFCPLEQELDGVDGLLLVLADGMGGYIGGALASKLVVEVFVESFCISRGSLPERLLHAMRACEKRMQAEIHSRTEEFGNMGATLVGAVWTRGKLHWISVGDSGLFLFRDKKLQRLNADHSMAPVFEEQVLRGDMSAEEASHHPDRNVLRSAVASEPIKLFELRDVPFELEPGDLVFAASDGLASVSDPVLARKLEVNLNAPADRIASALLIAVNEARKNRQDNATVAVIKNEAPAPVSIPSED